MNLLTVISLLACLLGAGIVALMGKIRPVQASAQEPGDWLHEFSIERYRPMLLLVDEANNPQRASLQTNLSPKQAEQDRCLRCRLLSGYLQEMNRDFERMTRAVHVLDPHSRHLSYAMQRGRLSFSRELNRAHRQLARYARGAGRLEFEKLLATFDSTVRELRRLPSAPALAA